MRLCCSYDYHINRPTIQLSRVCLKAEGFVESVYCERANERRTLKAKVRTEMRLCCSYDYRTNRPTIQLSIVCLKADGFVESVYCLSILPVNLAFRSRYPAELVTLRSHVTASRHIVTSRRHVTASRHGITSHPHTLCSCVPVL